MSYYGKNGGYAHPDGMIIRELKRNANIAGFGMLLTHGLSLAVSYALYFWSVTFVYGNMSGAVYDIIENSASLISYTIGLAVPIAFMVMWIRIPSDIAFPMKPPRASMLIPGIFFCLGVSVLGMYLSEFVSIAMQSFFRRTPIMPDMSMPQGGIAIALYCVNVVIAPAFLEEMMFRGVIMQSLRRFGDSFALIASALLFAMLHGNLVQGPNAFIMGIVIGYFVLRTGSLWTGIIIHFANNGIAVAADFAMRALPYEMSGYISFGMLAVYIVGGLISLAVLISRDGSLFKLSPSSIQMPESRKHKAFFTSIVQIILIFVTVIFTIRYLQ